MTKQIINWTLALALTCTPAAAQQSAPPAYKLYCSIKEHVAYFANFDSGDNDEGACKVTAEMWDAWLDSRGAPDHKCWCSVTVSA